MIFFQTVTQTYSEKEILSSPNRSRTYDLPITLNHNIHVQLQSCDEILQTLAFGKTTK